MFNKIIKHGHRKLSKADANEAAVFGYSSGYRNSGSVSTSNVTVNHASRTTIPSSIQQQGGLGSNQGSSITTGIVETLPLFRDVAISDPVPLSHHITSIIEIALFVFSISSS
ncbi:hypothetical protein FRX31_004206 [Thalictrum thalictroides]|uniref:Uncharacterized protein n=1 Tax=Thalictrum thalictroides TaxID=46969 RepID=A0A7J6XB51_THATH|nr:hypothetical protein FRX31_004206 [Thalictrum thalictroides]